MFIEKAHLVQIMYKYVQCTYLYIVHQANWGDATILSYSWHCYAAEMKAPRKILKIWHLYCGSSSSLMILADINSSERKQHLWYVCHLSIKTSSSPEYPPPKASKRPLFRAAIWKFTCRTFSHIIKPSTFGGSFGILGSGTKNRYEIKKSLVGKEDKKAWLHYHPINHLWAIFQPSPDGDVFPMLSRHLVEISFKFFWYQFWFSVFCLLKITHISIDIFHQSLNNLLSNFCQLCFVCKLILYIFCPLCWVMPACVKFSQVQSTSVAETLRTFPTIKCPRTLSSGGHFSPSCVGQDHAYSPGL